MVSLDCSLDDRDTGRCRRRTRNIEVISDAPGEWAMHCHMTHHVMNQVGHQFPNLVGIDTRGIVEAIGSL